jgi:hypothetical protein
MAVTDRNIIFLAYIMVTCFDVYFLIFRPYTIVLILHCAIFFPYHRARCHVSHIVQKFSAANLSIGVRSECAIYGSIKEMKSE